MASADLLGLKIHEVCARAPGCWAQMQAREENRVGCSVSLRLGGAAVGSLGGGRQVGMGRSTESCVNVLRETVARKLPSGL